MEKSPQTPVNYSNKSSTPGSKQTPNSDRRRRGPGLVRSRLSDSVSKKPRIGNFKSPCRNANFAGVKPAETDSTLKQNISDLKTELKSLEQEIGLLRKEGYMEEELQLHIKKMHEYNELKDTGQILLGKLAELNCVQTKDLYPNFGLDLQD